MIDAVTIAELRAEHRHGRALGIGVPSPRLSWISVTDLAGWVQQAYELEVDGVAAGRVESRDSVLVEWPAEALASRDRRRVRVRVWGEDGSTSSWSEPLAIEAGLLDDSDWSAEWITAEEELEGEGRPYHLRLGFDLPERGGARIERARLYVTSAGIHRMHLNGRVVGDEVLAPGWTAYAQAAPLPDPRRHRHGGRRAPTSIGAAVADGWWRGVPRVRDEARGLRRPARSARPARGRRGPTGTCRRSPPIADWRRAPGPVRRRRSLQRRVLRRPARASTAGTGPVFDDRMVGVRP